ncbi:LpqB family beta-propeller domain-containing protein [Streptomyces sp. CA-111067]|uniref:LpqB family beta-propeller domain-containing protein n=1 Tax=Streptomyces sp. CA-111067 TaxID=3240046 RepID=UPI003D97CD93
MRAVRSRGRLLRGAALPVCAGLLLAGCASMPSSGEVRKVDDSHSADSDAQVRVGAKAPHANESPSDIVGGFMEATTSSEADFATARQYLTKKADASWHGASTITVLSSGGLPSQDDTGSDKNKAQFTLYGTEAATVDAKHAYSPNPQPDKSFQTSFHLTKVDNKWRIDALAPGLVLSESDFQRMYHSVNMYYYASLGIDAQRQGATRQPLVADPMYLRQETDADPLQTTVSALFDGPTDFLAPVVSSPVPAGTKLYSKGADHGVTLDDSQHLRVRLDSKGDHISHPQCVRLAGQLFATVQAQASAKLESAEVQRADGSTACVLAGRDAPPPGPPESADSVEQYFIGQQGQLMRLGSESTIATAVPGPLGDDKAHLSSVAVRRDEGMAAGVLANRLQLVVGSLRDDRALGAPVYTSSAHDGKNGLTAPSWDGLGDLWVADRSTAVSKLLILRGGTGKAVEVPVTGLQGRVESVRVAADGVRIALVVNENGTNKLELGVIDRGGTVSDPQFTVTGLTVLTPAEENVNSVSWAGPSRLVVLGAESGVQQIQYVSTDGSAAPPLEAISSALSVAASEDQNAPLLASFNGAVYRLAPADANWKQLTPKGSNPVYPG